MVANKVPFDEFYAYAVLLFGEYGDNAKEFMTKAAEEGYQWCYRCKVTIYAPDAYMPLDVGSLVCRECAESYSRKEWDWTPYVPKKSKAGKRKKKNRGQQRR